CVGVVLVMADYYMKDATESERLRRTTFIAVLISTTAVLSSVITLPLVYNYIQAMQTHMSNELDFCRAKTRDLWVDVFAAQDSLNIHRVQSQSERAESRGKEYTFQNIRKVLHLQHAPNSTTPQKQLLSRDLVPAKRQL
ncbi:nematode cuticle collagen domain protein, partial [Ancylostoma duodenale]